ncbi:MAG: DNA primase, partial [Patescibacteria group bacterium]
MTPAEQIKGRLDIVSFIQGYIKLEKAGINYKARCPFHGEKTPSFFVSPARDGWHCFGCGKGGDMFTFLMEMEGIEFPEALRILAERTGVELKAGGPGEDRSQKTKLLAVLEEATRFFESNLKHEEEVKRYLKERGLSDETISSFRIGFAPDGWRTLSEHIKRQGYTDEELEQAGLAVQGSKGAYDRFRSRIIFPLEDALGRVIGFGGRIFPPNAKAEEGAKYINTPQTALYDKSRFLYGFNKAKTAIRTARHTVVVEGYMDCILSHQAGVAQTVAVSGTALTSSHLSMMRRLADAVTFAFDVDKAGIDASRRAVNLAYEQEFHVRVADIEGGKDPADIVLQDSRAWIKMVDDSMESIQFFLKKATEG